MQATKTTWTANFATRLATTLVIFSAIGLQAPPAKAGVTTGTISGYRATVMESGSYNRPDFIEVYGPNGKETIKVTCAPYDWNSYGANSANWAGTIAEAWCFGG